MKLKIPLIPSLIKLSNDEKFMNINNSSQYFPFTAGVYGTWSITPKFLKRLFNETEYILNELVYIKNKL